MKHSMKRVLAAAVALMIAAPAGALYAFGPANPVAQDDPPPKDCKMKPEDPRCKNQKY